MSKWLLTGLLIAVFTGNPSIADEGEGNILFSIDFKDNKDLANFKPLEKLEKKDRFEIQDGVLFLKAGSKDSFDIQFGDDNWTDYTLDMRFRVILPKRRSGVDIALRVSTKDEDEQWISMHIMRDSTGGKTTRWIRQYGRRYKEIMPNEFGYGYNDGKWHRLEFTAKNDDLSVRIDGEELYSFEDILSVYNGSIVLNVSNGASLLVDDLKVVDER